MNLHFLKNLIKHYWRATLIDVLHSPFVFNLYQQCIKRQRSHNAIFTQIESLRKELIQSNKPINYTDFGASNKSRKTTVNKIAKTHLKPARIAQIIHYIVKQQNPQNSIELGTSLGLTTSYIASALPASANFTSIEGCEDIYHLAQQNVTTLALNKQVNLQHGNFNHLFEPMLNALPQLDFLFIDGNHSYEATINYFNMALKKVNNNSLIIFDDIYWSEGMTQAWEEIKNHQNVTVTVDLFFIGLVFFRKEQRKQHFKLRVF